MSNYKVMIPREKRKEFIMLLAAKLSFTPFEFEFKVKNKPQGIRIIMEVTQEYMDSLMEDEEKSIN